MSSVKEVKVQATSTGYAFDKVIRPGEKFFFPEDKLSANWMRRIDGKPIARKSANHTSEFSARLAERKVKREEMKAEADKRAAELAALDAAEDAQLERVVEVKSEPKLEIVKQPEPVSGVDALIS